MNANKRMDLSDRLIKELDCSAYFAERVLCGDHTISAHIGERDSDGVEFFNEYIINNRDNFWEEASQLSWKIDWRAIEREIMVTQGEREGP